MTRNAKELISQNDMSVQNTALKNHVLSVPYVETGFFSGIVTDYLQQDTKLFHFYAYDHGSEGIKSAILHRERYPYNREVLVSALKKQYEGLDVHPNVIANITSLSESTTFSVTTAHQPNIFTGPLYFIYKILHAIRLAGTLKKQAPDANFVPVFFMGSEDADLDELGHFVVDGKKYEWKTKQTGAVGRMKVDKAFMTLIAELAGQLNVLPHGEAVISLFRNAYREGTTIQQCTLELVNSLFGEYGLVVLIPDNKVLKQLFQSVLQKELQEQFSNKAVEETIAGLRRHYKVQAAGRELNLFYLSGDRRERIELSGGKYRVPALGLEFSRDGILKELEQNPERFSPNVILRGVFQEMILPNIAFIGGGGEIAYWLELKKVFEAAGVPYPILVLRNSFLVLDRTQAKMLNDLGFTKTDLFKSNEVLLNELTARESANRLSLSEETGELNSFYQQLHKTAADVDPTLAAHVNMLQAKALKRIAQLEKKLLRSEKKKYEAEKRKIQKLKNALFPGGGLQERVENFSGFYAREGRSFIETMLEYSPGLEQQFTIVTL